MNKHEYWLGEKKTNMNTYFILTHFLFLVDKSYFTFACPWHKNFLSRPLLYFLGFGH